MKKRDIAYHWLNEDRLPDAELDTNPPRKAIMGMILMWLRRLENDIYYHDIADKILTSEERDKRLTEDFKDLYRWQYILDIYDKAEIKK